jgi:hypothetical protein
MTDGTQTIDGATTPEARDARPAPFTMVTGDPWAMVCEGDVCHVPGASGASGATN